MTEEPEEIHTQKDDEASGSGKDRSRLPEIREPVRLRDLEEQYSEQTDAPDPDRITVPIRLGDLEKKLQENAEPAGDPAKSLERNSANEESRRRKWRRILPAAAGITAAVVIIFGVSTAYAPHQDPAVPESEHEAAVFSQEPESPSLFPSAEPTPEVTPEVTPEPTPDPTPEPTPVPEPDFENTAVLGNSTTEAMYIFGSLPGPDYYYGTGLTVETVLTETMPGSSVAIIDELADKNYDTLIFAFGLNELGWSSPEAFIEKYKIVIDRAREYLPEAEIYLESVLPVGIETSHRNRFGVNQDQINIYNTYIHAMADEIGAHFLDVSEEFKGEDGYLPQDISADGIHPNKEGSDRWAALIVQRMRESMMHE